MFEGKRMEDGWKKQNNEEIRWLYNEPPISKVIKSRRLQCLEYLELMGRS